MLQIDVSDTNYATYTGPANKASTYGHADFSQYQVAGSAYDCFNAHSSRNAASYTAQGVIDLRGTPYVIANVNDTPCSNTCTDGCNTGSATTCFQWMALGWKSKVSVTCSDGNQRCVVRCGGGAGGCKPVNNMLQLAWLPPSPPPPSPPPPSPSPPPPPFPPKQFTLQLVVDVNDITKGPSPENVTVGLLIESMASLPNSTEATIEVTVTQNWKVEFEEGGVDAGGVNAFNKLLTACQVLYPSCTGKIVPITSRLRRALGSTQTAVFTRPLSNSSEPITMIPQLVAENVTVETSTFVSATAALSVTALGGAADADALSDGSLSPGAVASAVSASLGLNEDTLAVSDPQPIFPPMPPPSLPPSPPPSPPLPPPPSPPSPPSPSPPPPSPSAPEDECAGLEDKKCKIKKCEDSKKKLKKCKKQCKKKKLKKKCKKTCCDAGF